MPIKRGPEIWFILILMSKIKRQLKVLHLPQQREIFSFLPILEESDALIVGALIFTMIGIGKSTPTIKLYSSPRSSQNGIIKILILAKCLLYLLFDKRA